MKPPYTESVLWSGSGSAGSNCVGSATISSSLTLPPGWVESWTNWVGSSAAEVLLNPVTLVVLVALVVLLGPCPAPALGRLCGGGKQWGHGDRCLVMVITTKNLLAIVVMVITPALVFILRSIVIWGCYYYQATMVFPP